jgi:hypothetical protein
MATPAFTISNATHTLSHTQSLALCLQPQVRDPVCHPLQVIPDPAKHSPQVTDPVCQSLQVILDPALDSLQVKPHPAQCREPKEESQRTPACLTPSHQVPSDNEPLPASLTGVCNTM